MKIAKAKLKKIAEQMSDDLRKEDCLGKARFDTILYYLSLVNNGDKKQVSRKAARKAKASFIEDGDGNEE